jgi:hypothetical protein
MTMDYEHRPLPWLTDLFDIVDDDDPGDVDHEQDFDFDYIRTNVDDEEMMEEDVVEHTPHVSMIRADARLRVDAFFFSP